MITAILFVLASTVVYASPAIQINSPQNATYSEYGPVPINITSSEPVNIYHVSKNGKKIPIARNATSYLSNLYGSRGTINFTIYANNSNGSDMASLVLTINHSSIINVTTCGGLGSPNTTYVLQNNISSDEYCIYADTKDYIFDLNHFTVTSANLPIVAVCDNSRIMNGNVIAGHDAIEFDEGTKCQVVNLTIESGGLGMYLAYFSSSLIKNVTINGTTTGFLFDTCGDIYMKDIRLTTDKPDSIGIFFYAFDSIFNIDNSNFTGFTYDARFDVNNLDVYLRNNVFNLYGIDETSYIGGRVRLFKEHLLKINVTNQTGHGIPASVELIDNGVFARTDREENTYTFDSNPTGNIFIGTNENGTAETFITERLITLKTESPVTFAETIFSPYTVIARTAQGTNITTNVNVILNSTLQTNFTIILPSAAALPACTVEQMLDLNNDGTLNSKDAHIILRKMVGHNVTVNSTKQCSALNFLPV